MPPWPLAAASNQHEEVITGIYAERPWLDRYDPGQPADIDVEFASALAMFDACVARDPDARIIRYLERLAAYKYPREVEILDELPKTVTGKLLRRELRTRTSGALTELPLRDRLGARADSMRSRE